MEKIEIEVTHTGLLFDSHHPLQHRLGVISSLHHREESISIESKKKDDNLKAALKVCGYPEWAFNKTASSERITDRAETQSRT